MKFSVHLIGRFGNQLFQYAHAKALAEKSGEPLETNPWIGQKMFGLSDPPLTGDPTITGYAQDQASLIYTRADCRRWFSFRPQLFDGLSLIPKDTLLAHRRVGDYTTAGYPVLSKLSYLRCCQEFALDAKHLKWVTEEDPFRVNGLEHGMEFLPDFWRMMHCDTLLRGNSSFSWWAATLGTCRVFSPLVDHALCGVECDVRFTEGNHPRLATFGFTTDLYLS